LIEKQSIALNKNNNLIDPNPQTTNKKNNNYSTNNTDTVLSNRITNPYSSKKDVYYKKTSETNICGKNGSTICDLVIEQVDESTGAKYYKFISNLFNPEDTPQLEYEFTGAELVKFTNTNTLILNYKNYDHGQKIFTVYEFDIENKKLNFLFQFFAEEQINETTYTTYSFTNNNKTLIFKNSINDNGQPINNIYLEEGNEHTVIPISLSEHLTIELDIEKNVVNPNYLYIDINSEPYIFDFEKKSFVII
jgi:hypothetical protein